MSEIKTPKFVEDFANYLVAIRNLSQVYIKNMTVTIEQFLEFINVHKFKNKYNTIEDITLNEIRSLNNSDIYSFIFFLAESHYQNNSRVIKIEHLKTFFDYLFNIKHTIFKEPFKKINSERKLEKKLPNYLSLDEAKRLINLYKNSTDEIEIRDNAMLHIFLNCGLRLSEIKNLNIEDINLDDNKFTIIGKSGEDFSYLPAVERDDSIVISQFTLKELVRQTIFSISDNDNNKLMTGELFDINGDEFKIVSLDGHRISIRKIQMKNSYAPKKVVVPGKTLNEVSKILPGDADSDVTISFTEKHIVFEFDKTVVVSRLIEGEYFKIDQMLSSDYETKVKVNKKEFLSCIDRATLLVKEGDKKPIIVNITDNGMELKINSALGSMNEEIDIQKQGKDLMIGFNPKFLIDALRVIDDEEVDLYMVNPKAPCFIKNVEESYIYLILPVNFTTVA